MRSSTASSRYREQMRMTRYNEFKASVAQESEDLVSDYAEDSEIEELCEELMSSISDILDAFSP